MISENYRCLFIHIPKNSGTSVGAALGIDPSHMRIEEAKKKLGDQWNNYFKWTIVRNPWDRFISLYFFRKKNNNFEFKVDKQPTFKEWLPWYLYWEAKDHELADKELDKEGKRYWKHDRRLRVSQLNWLTIEDVMQIDFVGRFERLKEDFSQVAERIGYKGDLPCLNVTKHDHYVKYYDTELTDLVYKVCIKDIDAFGYRFGEDTISLL